MLKQIGQALLALLCIALPIYAMVLQKKSARLTQRSSDVVSADPPDPNSCAHEEFVHLAVFDTIVMADLCRSKLEAEGIECVVLGRPVVSRRVLPSVAVKASDWHRAAELIKEAE